MDSEIKILVGCTESEKDQILSFHNNSEFMAAIMIRRPIGKKEKFTKIYNGEFMRVINKIEIIKADITTLEVDVIVNAANSSLMGGGGVDGAIHRAAGRELLDECILISKKQGGCKPGDAVITAAGNLKCKKIIHTVGPVWHGGKNNEENILSSCYKKSLELAGKYNLNTIAFPNISTGVYGYPKLEAAKTALKTVIEYLEFDNKIEKVIFVCFDNDNYGIYRNEIKIFI